MLRQDRFQNLFYFVHHTSQSSWLYYIRPVWFTNNLFLQLSRLSKALITFSALSVNRSLLRLLHCQHISHCVDATPTHCFLPVMVLRGTQHCSYRSTKHKEVEEGGREEVSLILQEIRLCTVHMRHNQNTYGVIPISAVEGVTPHPTHPTGMCGVRQKRTHR